MKLSVLNWLLAMLPVLALLASLLFLKWEAAKAGALAWVLAFFIGLLAFGADVRILALSISKGMSLSIYVLLIIWPAIFLYQVADRAQAIGVIGGTISTVTEDKNMLALLLAWCFTSLLQGLAGFGVPVAVVAPIMVAMGFAPLKAVVICLLGHSWAISFGSMGSSYNSVQLVTGIPGELIGPQMAMLFSVAIFATGLEVAYINGGKVGLKGSILPVLTIGGAMSLMLLAAASFGFAQLATLSAAMVGCLLAVVWSICRRSPADHPKADVKHKMNFHLAAAPYYMVIGITLLSQVGGIKAALKSYFWGLDYPALTTVYGYEVAAVSGYSKIQLFAHPGPILIFSAVAGGLLYWKSGNGPAGLFASAGKDTVRKCIPTSLGISTMVMMALIMADSGMVNLIAQGLAKAMGTFYPLVSPFIGVLGTFITGSNTNSNIMFGLMQYETGLMIGANGILLAAAQSVGGSLGVAIAPSTIMMGAANVGLDGQENVILQQTVLYCMLNVALVGLMVWLAA